jgi:hypothetical protein
VSGEVASAWSWEIATEPNEVHRLLLASDEAAAADQPPPKRSLEATRRRVAAGSVHLLRWQDKPAAMFTLDDDAPFDLAEAGYPPAGKALFLQRLAVDPEIQTSQPLVGARALRRAIRLATDAGAAVLRSEANPDLKRAFALLSAHGFMTFGSAQDQTGRRRVYLQKTLA